MMAKSLMLNSSNIATRRTFAASSHSSLRIFSQLGGNNLIKMGWRPAPQKMGLVLALMDVDSRPVFNLPVHLSIRGKDAILRAGKNLQLDRGLRLQNQRTIKGQMRSNRREHTALDLWMEQRPSYGHIIGGRTGSGAQDDPISKCLIIEVIIDPDMDLHHARPGSTSDHNIIQRQELFALPILLQFREQHRAPVDPD